MLHEPGGTSMGPVRTKAGQRCSIACGRQSTGRQLLCLKTDVSFCWEHRGVLRRRSDVPEFLQVFAERLPRHGCKRDPAGLKATIRNIKAAKMAAGALQRWQRPGET